VVTAVLPGGQPNSCCDSAEGVAGVGGCPRGSGPRAEVRKSAGLARACLLADPSQEAVRAEERLAPVRAKLSADEFRRRVRQIYEHETGKPAPEAMGEKEFQDWLVEMATDLQMSRYEPPSERIPNPVRLIAALQK